MSYRETYRDAQQQPDGHSPPWLMHQPKLLGINLIDSWGEGATRFLINVARIT
ncbi:MAG: hypothetical protein ABL915_05405 [Gallionella sp.]